MIGKRTRLACRTANVIGRINAPLGFTTPAQKIALLGQGHNPADLSCQKFLAEVAERGLRRDFARRCDQQFVAAFKTVVAALQADPDIVVLRFHGHLAQAPARSVRQG